EGGRRARRVLGRRAHPSALSTPSATRTRLAAMTSPSAAPAFAGVLVHPEIPPNTGNVIRLTANTATDLHLVEPLGFRMNDRDLRRAGLDYHEYARVAVHRDFAACRAALDADAPRRWFAFTTPASRSAYAVAYLPGDVLVFGSETRGLPLTILEHFPADTHLRIPMRAG